MDEKRRQRLDALSAKAMLIHQVMADCRGAPIPELPLNASIRPYFDSEGECVVFLWQLVLLHPNIAALFERGLVLGFADNDMFGETPGGRTAVSVVFEKGVVEALRRAAQDGYVAFLRVDFERCTVIDVAHALLELDAHTLIVPLAKG